MIFFSRNHTFIVQYLSLAGCLALALSCAQNQPSQPTPIAVAPTPIEKNGGVQKKTEPPLYHAGNKIYTGNLSPQELLNFATSLTGVPYLYASTDPAKGFDCSGYITYVFNHFNIAVPRSSQGFTHIEQQVPLQAALPGDLILFTGTDSSDRTVGHMGIIISADSNPPVFIHASSGKANGVTITPLNNYYMGRFVKVIRVFRRADDDI